MRNWHLRLAHALTVRGITGAALALETKVKPASVSDWVSGKTKMMGGANAVVACAFLRIKPEWLFFGREPSGLNPGEEQILTGDADGIGDDAVLAAARRMGAPARKLWLQIGDVIL